MLSENLQYVHDKLDRYRHEGLSLSPVALIGLCNFLKAAADDVRQLEARTVPLPARLGDDLPGNVLNIADRLIARGTCAMQRVDRPDADPDGAPGGAA